MPQLPAVHSALDAAGRPRHGFEIVITPQTVRNDDIQAYRDAGVDRLVLHLGSQKAEAIDRRLGEVAEMVERLS